MFVGIVKSVGKGEADSGGFRKSFWIFVNPTFHFAL